MRKYNNSYTRLRLWVTFNKSMTRKTSNTMHYRELVGAKWKENGLVFCNRVGGYVDKDRNLARFRKVLVEAGLPPKMRVHDLRHNVATFLINVLHYPPNLVQALLGHSDVAVTMREYAGEIDLEM